MTDENVDTADNTEVPKLEQDSQAKAAVAAAGNATQNLTQKELRCRRFSSEFEKEKRVVDGHGAMDFSGGGGGGGDGGGN